jgi:hypothetical protein
MYCRLKRVKNKCVIQIRLEISIVLYYYGFKELKTLSYYQT